MKIGIITFHRANNIGAVLQASALFKYVDDNIGTTEIIDYYPNNNINNNKRYIFSFLHYVKQLIFLPKTVVEIKRKNSFKKYIEENYVLSPETYYGDKDIKVNPPHYDYLISGSDQILNVTLSGNSTAYYLDFNNYARKISYGSSFGRENISDLEIDLIKKELTKFYACSFREKAALRIVKDITGIEGDLVLDPVFLLDETEWNRRCNHNMKLPSKFIFVYSMETSSSIIQTVELAKKQFNIPIIVVRGGGKKENFLGKKDNSCGPSEFLQYIKKANLIITNSFHGTAFSLIFKKKFICVAHSKRNIRLENIMELCGTKDKILSLHSNSESLTEKIINGEIGMRRLEDYIQDSKEYLKKQLLT